MQNTKTTAKLKAWPTPQDYNEAIQNPHHNLSDPELQSGKIEANKLGLPKPITGAFASVYRVHCKDKDYAVRCFLRDIPDAQWRYERISDFVQHDDLTYTVGFEFQPGGIKVAGLPYPVLKMEWVPGETLDNYLRHHHEKLDPTLPETFKKMCLDLNAAGIAHGDLQHGNIMVRDGQLFLVDYDGMYVPSMQGTRSNELGHRNYQHPLRSADDFGAYLDNFSAWVIYASLRAIEIDPSLYERLGAGEDCLLFRREDFEQPLVSCAFKALEEHHNPELAQLGRSVRSLLAMPLQAIPPLDALEINTELAGLNYDAPSSRDEQRRRAAADFQQISIPALSLNAEQSNRARIPRTSVAPKRKGRIKIPAAAPTTVAATSSLPSVSGAPKFSLGKIEPELLVPAPRSVQHIPGTNISDDFLNWIARAFISAVFALGCFVCSIWITSVPLFIGSAVLVWFAVYCFANATKPSFGTTDARWLVENGEIAIGRIDSKDMSNDRVFYSFVDFRGHRRMGYQIIDADRWAFLRIGDEVTVLYNPDQFAKPQSVLYKYCHVRANGSQYFLLAAAGKSVPVQPPQLPAARPPLTTTSLAPDLQIALAGLRAAVNSLKSPSAPIEQPSSVNVQPAATPGSNIAPFAKNNALDLIEPSLLKPIPRTVAPIAGGAPPILLVAPFFIFVFLLLMSAQLHWPSLLVPSIVFVPLLFCLLLAAAPSEEGGDAAVHKRLLTWATATRGYVVGINRITSGDTRIEYIFDDDHGNRHLSTMVGSLKADDAFVGQELTVLYDPQTHGSMIYKYCRHARID